MGTQQTKQIWTTAELKDAGWDDRRIAAAVTKKALYKLMNGWYVTDPSPRLTLAAYATAYPKLVYTGNTASFLLGVGPMRWPAEADHPSSTRRDPRIRIRRRIPRPSLDLGDLRVSTPAAIAASLVTDDEDAAIKVLETGYSGLTGSARLTEDLEDLSGTGRAKLESIRNRSVIGTASGLEKKALLLIRKSLKAERDRGEITIETNVMVRGYCFDIVIPEVRLLIEIDSYTYHGGGNARRTTFTNDRCKGNQATRWDYHLLRYSDLSVNKAPEYVATEVADTVRHLLKRLRRNRREDEAIDTDRPMKDWHPRP
jgi:very-short-patch-repair endonuclease